MCFAEIEDGKCNCLPRERGPCYTHYDEVIRITEALRSRLYQLHDRWKFSDKLDVNVKEFLESGFFLTENIKTAALKGKQHGNSEEETRTETE
jgi:hypothetical protein